MAYQNLSVFLRNDSGSPIVMGSLSIAASASEQIWDTVNYTSGIIDNFTEVVDNIGVFNQNIGSGDLVLVVNTVDQATQDAFDQFQELLEVYNQLDLAEQGFSILRLDSENTQGLTIDHEDLINNDQNVHPQYVATDGSNPITGDINADGYEITVGEGVELGNAYEKTKEPTGFPNRTDSQISFDDGTRTFTIEPVSGSFEYLYRGKPIIISSTKTIVWDDVEGVHGFALDENGDLIKTTSSSTIGDWILGDAALVSVIYWDATNNESILRVEERHGFMPGDVHWELHQAFGAQWISGGELTDIVIGDGSSNTHAQLGVSDVSIADEDIRLTFTDGSPQGLSAPINGPVFYRSGSNGDWRRKTPDDYPMIYTGTAGYSGTRIPYNADASDVGITFVGSEENSVTATSITLNVPTGVQDDDVLIAIVCHAESEDNTFTTPTGWTLVVNELQTGGFAPSVPGTSVWIRVASSEPGSYAFNGTFSSGIVGTMLAYRNVDTTTPQDATVTTTTGSGTEPDPPSITTVSDDALVIAIGFKDDGGEPITDTSAEYVQRSIQNNPSGGNGCSLGVCENEVLDPGAENPGPFTSGADEWAGITLALRPAAAGATDWQLLEAGEDTYVLMHAFANNSVSEPVCFIQGQAQYDSLEEASTGATTEINALKGIVRLLGPEFVALGTIILQTNSSYSNTPNARFVRSNSGAKYIDQRGNTSTGFGNIGGGGVTVHGDLDGLGVDDHPQYFLTDGNRDMTGNLNLGGNTVLGFGSDLDLDGYNITDVGTVDGVDVSNHSARHENGGADEISVAGLSGLLADAQTPLSHASTHISGASDEIDGDQLDIDWDPTNYTPATTPAEVTSVDQLTAHLYGIDQALGGFGDVSGPGSSTDNALVRWDGTGGDTVQNSGWTLSDADRLEAGGDLDLNNNDILGVNSITIDGENLDAVAVDDGGTVRRMFGFRGSDQTLFIGSDNVSDGTDKHKYEANTQMLWEISNSAKITVTATTTTFGNPLDMGTNNITNVGTVDGVDVSAHAARHVLGGADEIDGDELDIDFTPSNYTPTTGTPGSNVDHLAAHLRGIDNAITGGTGDVTGPGSATDNAIARFDGTTGKIIQNSSVTIDDSGNMDLGSGNITTSGTVDGVDVSAHASRHNPGGADALATATASTLSGSNAEGSAASFARSDHNHALGGSVGGDLSGTLPNPTVTDLTISSEEQGSVLYFDGSNWVQLAPGDDGYALLTQGPGANPVWGEVASSSTTGTVFAIWAEENASLASGTYEWAFGNGANTPNGNGIIIPVACEMFAMGLVQNSADTAEVRLEVNGSAPGYSISLTSQRSGYTVFGTPLQISPGDVVNFYTVEGNSNSPNQVVAWFRANIADVAENVVVNTGSSTDNAIARFDGTTGKLIQNSGVTIDDNDVISGVDSIQLDLKDPAPSHSEGLIFYDDVEKTLAVYNDQSSITHQLGQELLVRVYNNTGSTITNGSAVYITGAFSGRPTVALAQADSAITARVLGVATQDISNSTEGFVTVRGGLTTDTSSFSAGDPLYLSPSVAGGLTDTAPSGSDIRAAIGLVETVGASGRIFVDIQKIPYLDDKSLSVPGDITISTNGSSLVSPRVVGFVDLSSGEGARVQYGDTANGWQNGFGQSMQMWSYHTLIFEGDRSTVAAPSFETTSNIGVLVRNTTAGSPALVVDGASGQSADLQQWRDSGGATLISVDDQGNIVMAGSQTVDGVDVSSHASRHVLGGADEIDGDELDIDFTPSNYTPATGTPGSNVDHLAAHLRGIDNAISGGSGDVVGPGSSTDNAIARFDGTTGKLIQNSSATIDDSGNISTGGSITTSTGITVSGNITVTGTVDGVDVSNHSSRHNPGGTDALATATASSVGASNAEGSAASFARSDHTHAVTDLSISSQEQGSILYYNGSNWVELPPGTDGQVLETQGTGANPQWVTSSGGSSPAKLEPFSYASTDVTNINVYQNGFVWFVYFVPDFDITVTQMQVHVSQSGTGSVWTGIYSSDGSTRLGHDSTGVSTGSTGLKTTTLDSSVSLTGGTGYYLAVAASGNGSLFSGKSVATSSVSPIRSGANSSGSNPSTGVPSSITISNAQGSAVWISVLA